MFCAMLKRDTFQRTSQVKRYLENFLQAAIKVTRLALTIRYAFFPLSNTSIRYGLTLLNCL